MILEQLERTHWNRKKTARELQISYKALLYKLKQLGLDGSGPKDGQ
jgi:DNA-binding NtrC family response regulator